MTAGCCIAHLKSSKSSTAVTPRKDCVMSSPAYINRPDPDKKKGSGLLESFVRLDRAARPSELPVKPLPTKDIVMSEVVDIVRTRRKSVSSIRGNLERF
jgi:hypothetical protein